MVGKMRPDFPMIGKIFRRFSNDWKTFSGASYVNKKDQRATKEEEAGMSDNYDYF